MSELQKAPWFENKKLVIVLLIVFFPVGLFALWKNSAFTTKAKGIITAVVVVFFVAAMSQNSGDTTSIPAREKTGGQKTTAADSNVDRGSQIEIELAKLKGELAASEKKLDELGSKYVPFQIAGKVNDRDEGVIQIWGLSVPQNHDFTLVGACRQECNIIVVDPLKDKDYGHYYGPAFHYFSEKKYGTNRFGGKVPAFVFGGPPSDLARAEKKRNGLSHKIRALEEERAKLREAAMSPEERAAKAARKTLSDVRFVYKGRRTTMT